MEPFRRRLEAALSLDLIDPHRVIHAGRPAAVLILFGQSTGLGKGQTDPLLLLTRRTESVETHKGQYAFPGGTLDAEDHEELGLVTTALRETEEEVGIARSQIDVIGKLPDFWTPTGFMVTPVVGVLSPSVSSIVLRPSPDEIAEAFWVPMSVLAHSETYKQESMEILGARHPIHVYQIDEHRVWGVTAAIIKNLLDRLSAVL